MHVLVQLLQEAESTAQEGGKGWRDLMYGMGDDDSGDSDGEACSGDSDDGDSALGLEIAVRTDALAAHATARVVRIGKMQHRIASPIRPMPLAKHSPLHALRAVNFRARNCSARGGKHARRAPPLYILDQLAPTGPRHGPAADPSAAHCRIGSCCGARGALAAYVARSCVLVRTHTHTSGQGSSPRSPKVFSPE